MSIDQEIVNSTRQLEADVRINHEITQGDENTEVETEGGPVPSIRKRLKDIETDWAKTADPLADDLASTVQVTKSYKDDAANSATDAKTSKTGADQARVETEAARDAATAIVYEGDASLEPGAGKLAVADEEGKLSHLWLKPIGVPTPDFHMPLSSDIHIREGNGTATFTRASKKNSINSQGHLTEVDVNKPAFGQIGLLLETESTNFITHTNPNDPGLRGIMYYWSDQRQDAETIKVNNPFGELSDVTQFTQKQDGYLRLRRSAAADGNVYAGSIFVKGVTGTIFVRGTQSESYTPNNAVVQPDNRITDKTGTISVMVESLVNGWRRIGAYDPDATESIAFEVKNGEIWQAWGGQIELQTYPSSYILPNGSSATRSMDTLALPVNQYPTSQPYTMHALIKFPTGNFSGYVDVIRTRGFAYNQWRFQHADVYHYIDGGGCKEARPNDVFSITSTYDSDQTQSLYINGLKVNQKSPVKPHSNIPIRESFLELFKSSDSNFPGVFEIRDFMIWNHVLSPEQIYNL